VRAAAEAFDLGRQAYKDGRYTEAAEQFEHADSSAPSSTALELAIRSRDKAGDLDRAGTLASLALALYPDDENIQKIAPDVVSRAGASMFELNVTCKEPCELADGKQTVHGNAARTRTVFLGPGQHSLRAGFSGGKTESKSVDAVAGGSGTLDFSGPKAEVDEGAEAPPPEEPKEQPAQPEDQPKSNGWSPTIFWAGVGATAVAGGVTIWSGIDTVNNPGADKVKATCAKGDTNCDLYKQGRSKQTRTNVLLGVTGGLALATGLIGAIAVEWGPPSVPGADEGRNGKAHVRPWFAWRNGGPAFGARGSF
jgi:tetratricopeptide (TPR) repeat protein